MSGMGHSRQINRRATRPRCPLHLR